MKVSARKALQILKQAQAVAEAYNVFRKASEKMSVIVEPLQNAAADKGDVEMLKNLIELTTAIDKKGNYNRVGEFIGRHNLFFALVATEDKLKKKKKKARNK